VRREVILQELIKRGERLRAAQGLIIDEGFPAQARAVSDRSQRLAFLCTRRAGKTTGLALRYFNAGQRFPGAILPYFALTRDSARNIMWPVLREMDAKFNVGAEFIESRLRCVLPSGAEIVLMGADMTNFIGRVRGIKTPFAAIDEAQKFRNSILGELIDDILTPALADYGTEGCLAVGGTPGPLPKGKFHEITTGGLGYSIHRWSLFDNPYMPDARAFVRGVMEANGWDETNPTYRREYLGEWVADTDALVYKYDPLKNWVAELPQGEYRYVLGVDLGYSPDPSAFVLMAYRPHDPTLYVVDAYKRTEMIASDVAERIRYYLKDHSPCTVVIDAGGGGKQVAEEIRQRYNLPVLAAEKQGKNGFIELMNSDLRKGSIKVVGDSAKALVEEWQSLIWDDREPGRERKEHPEYDNHAVDSALYAWRWAYNYASRPKVVKPPIHSEAAVEQWAERESEKLERARTRLPWDLDDEDEI